MGANIAASQVMFRNQTNMNINSEMLANVASKFCDFLDACKAIKWTACKRIAAVLRNGMHSAPKDGERTIVRENK